MSHSYQSVAAAESAVTATHSHTDGEFTIGTVKTFFHKKLHSASNLIKKQKPHTCKVTVVTARAGSMQLMVSDGTFMSEVSRCVWRDGW
jgi:hypothetical protein